MLSKFEAWIRSLDFVDVDATKSAWRDDAADIQSLDSLQVDATMPAWRLCGDGLRGAGS